MSSYVLGIDIGTSTVKAVLTDKESGKIVQENYQSLGSKHAEVTGGEVKGAFHERKVDVIMACLQGCIQGLGVSMLERVCAVGVCGQMHGSVLWNSNMKLSVSDHTTIPETFPNRSCSNLITWQDGRCDEDFLSSLPTSHQPISVSTGYGCATLAWLQHHQPNVIEKFDRAGTIMDLITWIFCTAGETNPSQKVLMSSQNATSWGYFDIEKMEWELDLLSSTNFPVRLLPKVVCVPSLAGGLQRTWYGIPKGALVAVGMGDLQCSVLATQPSTNDAILNVGSASQFGVIRSAKLKQESSLVLPSSVMEVPYFGKDTLVVAASLTGANIFSTLVKTLQGWMEELCISRESIPPDSQMYEKLIELAGARLDTSLQIGVNLWGERHDTALTGTISNIKLENLSLGDISSAMFRGMVENLQAMMPKELLHILQVKQILGCGSALQRNLVLQQHTKAIFNLPLELRDKADAPFGAAAATKKLLES